MGVGMVALWATAWAMIAACTVLAFRAAVYWHSVAAVCCHDSTTQFQSPRLLQPQSPQWKYVDSPCRGCRYASGQSREPIIPDVAGHVAAYAGRTQAAPRERNYCNLLAAEGIEPQIFLALSRALPREAAFLCPSAGYPQPKITADLACKNHSQTAATPIDFI